MQTSKLIFIASICCAFTGQASAIVRCELGGKSVNPNNGNETAGLTGMLRCKDEDSGKLQREQELRNGKNVGLERFFDRNGNIIKERTINERGNTQGLETTFWPNGQVKSEETADNGQTQGAVRQFYETGKLRRLSFVQDRRELFEISFNTDGSYAELRCHASSVLAEDRKPCGFEGKTDTKILDQTGKLRALQTWEQGKLLVSMGYRDNGELESDMRFEQGRRVHKKFHDTKNQLREERVFETSDHILRSSQGSPLTLKQWAASGQLVLHTRYADGKANLTERWYLNGALKEKVSVTGSSNTTRTLRENYADTGKIASRETLNADNQVVGLRQMYFSNGNIMREDAYSEPDGRGRTQLTRRREWDESGKLTADDEILEDGSRRR
jgi:antitoxin component YwqK of YwqJK toxin-antitoxin module